MMPTSFNVHKTGNDWFDNWNDSLTSIANAATGSSISFKNVTNIMTNTSDNWKVLLPRCIRYSYGSITADDTGNDTTPVTKPIVKVDEAPAIKRRPAPLEFNKYINASDLLEEFIRYCGEQGVRQREMLELPVDLFIKWLIIRACEADKEEPNVTLELPAPKRQCRCLGCGKFMRRGLALPMHDPRCYNFYFVRSQRALSHL